MHDAPDRNTIHLHGDFVVCFIFFYFDLLLGFIGCYVQNCYIFH